jgi:hypothetical protein
MLDQGRREFISLLARACFTSLQPKFGAGSQWETIMANLVDRHFVERANTVLLLGILWAGLAACVLGALFYDIAYWFEGR